MIDEVVIANSKDYAIAAVALYSRSDFGGAKSLNGTTIPTREVGAVGVRPYYFLTKTQAVAVEVGTSVYKNPWIQEEERADKQWQLNKFTLAYNIRPNIGITGKLGQK